MPRHALTPRAHSPRTRLLSSLGLSVLLVVAGTAAATLDAGAASGATAKTTGNSQTRKGRSDLPPIPLSVSVDALGVAGPTIPADFLGLSMEARQISFPQTDATYGNLAAMLKSLGTGTIRFGGDTVETTTFVGGPNSALPPTDWKPAYTITPNDLARLATLTQASGWKIVLGVNLGHYDPQRAADEVVAASAALGPSLMAAEVGNEPNAYVNRGLRDSSYSIADYQSEFESYRDAISAVSPTIPVVGSSSYPPSFLNSFDPGLNYPGAFVSQHEYPLNACSSQVPTIPNLLARNTAAREANDIKQGLAVAQSHGIPLRLTETNSVICSGYNGVSNTLAGGLWTVDDLLQDAALGVAGVNLHGGIQVCGAPTSAWYTPLCAADTTALAANVFTPQPDFYGMEFVSRLAGTSFVKATYAAKTNVVVRATRDTSGGVHTVIEDMDPDGSPDTYVRLQLPVGFDSAQVEMLSGGGLASPAITMDGGTIGLDGTLAVNAPIQVTGRGGVVYVRVPAGSVALVNQVAACTVPSVKGLSLADARIKLIAGGCVSGIVHTVAAPLSTPQYVTSQALPAGFRYPFGQAVHLQLKPKPVVKKPATTVKATPKAVVRRAATSRS